MRFIKSLFCALLLSTFAISLPAGNAKAAADSSSVVWNAANPKFLVGDVALKADVVGNATSPISKWCLSIDGESNSQNWASVSVSSQRDEYEYFQRSGNCWLSTYPYSDYENLPTGVSVNFTTSYWSAGSHSLVATAELQDGTMVASEPLAVTVGRVAWDGGQGSIARGSVSFTARDYLYDQSIQKWCLSVDESTDVASWPEGLDVTFDLGYSGGYVIQSDNCWYGRYRYYSWSSYEYPMELSPPSVNIDSTQWSNGSHALQLSIIVADATYQSDTLAFYVANGLLNPPTGLSVTPLNASVVTQWSASPNYGDVTLLHYVATATDSQSNEFSCTTTATTCAITGLTNGTPYTVSVVAVSAAGSLVNPESKSTVPHKIAWGLSSQLVSGVAKLTWRASPANDNCTIQKSFDSVHWSTLGTSSSQAFQVSAAALSISVRVVSSEGVATAPISVTTPGVAPQMIKVVTATGAPVSGGSVTWAMDNGKAHSSTAYGLLSDGSYSFPAAPGGPVQITLRNGVMPDGALATGTFPGVLSSDSTMVVQLPPEYSGAFHKVQVVTPGGLPVWNAHVTVENISTAITVGAATFTIPSQYVPANMYCDSYNDSNDNSYDCSRTDLVTDVTGTTSFWGYYQASTSSESDNSTSITVSYDDGVMTQTPAVVRPSLDVNVVSLDYEPVVLPVTSTVLATAPGAQTSVTITLNAGAQPRTSLLRSHLAGVLVGRQVTVVPPAGLKTCARQVLRAVSNAQGKATFRFCATKSGQFRFTSPGLLIPGAVTVWVKGGVASAVQSLRTSLPKRGTVNVAWGVPVFSGGLPITGYQVSYAQPGKKVTTVITKALTIQIPGLVSTARYSVTVAPITKVGVGVASVLSVSVA